MITRTIKDATAKRMVHFLVFSNRLLSLVNVSLPGQDVKPNTISGRMIAFETPLWRYNAAVIAVLSAQKAFEGGLYRQLKKLVDPMFHNFITESDATSLQIALSRRGIITAPENVEKATKIVDALAEFAAFKREFVNGVPLLVDPYASEFIAPPLLYFQRRGEYLFTMGDFSKTIRQDNAGKAYRAAVKLYAALLAKYKDKFKEQARDFYERFTVQPKKGRKSNILDGYNGLLAQALHIGRALYDDAGELVVWQNGSHDYHGVRYGNDHVLILRTNWKSAIKPAMLALFRWNKATKQHGAHHSIRLPVAASLTALYPGLTVSEKPNTIRVGNARMIHQEQEAEAAEAESTQVAQQGGATSPPANVRYVAQVSIGGKWVPIGNIKVEHVNKRALSPDNNLMKRFLLALQSLNPDADGVWIVKGAYKRVKGKAGGGKQISQEMLLWFFPDSVPQQFAVGQVAYHLHRKFGGKEAV